ncbi:MAG: hypothetical protein GXP27_07935 [Planctomycetes bacterium]|nr:hypothetical protein [Planctomycetota bacterium]
MQRKRSSRELLEEYAALEYILLGDLRDLLEEPPDEVTRQWLRAVLDALLQTLPCQFNLKEQGGYLREVVDEYPTWSNLVDQLRREHAALFERLQELRARLDHDGSFQDIADGLRIQLRDWLRSVIAFHRHEKRLVQTAMNLEVGVGD